MRVSAGLLIGSVCMATAGVVLNAFMLHKQFYPSIVYLTKSNPSMFVIYFQALVLVYLLFQLVRTIFFGELRASEAEHLSERAWHAVLETCLAFTVFRDEFSPTFVMQFVIMLFVKSFHWLADLRVDMMERSPVITLKFHVRMMLIICFLGAVDSYLVSYAYFTTIVKGATGQIIFGFEYAILMTLVIHVTIKYLLHMLDLRTTQAWDNKAVYLLYAELLINLIRCALYGSFAIVMIRVHTFPLFFVRPFYVSVRALHKAFYDVILSRRAINAMNNNFPMVTTDELASMDATCIICREEMTVEGTAKRLPCSHVFHTHCLRSWFQRQQTCPTCRTEIWGRRIAQQQNAVPAADGNAANAGQQMPMAPPPFFPFHPFAFAQQNQQAGAQQQQQQAAGPFPHPIFYAPPPPNRPEFMMGPMPPMPSFPVPPPPFQLPVRPSFDGLTDQEIQQLEGNMRSAVEARIRLLYDVWTLLDAANINMQIYLSNSGPVNLPSEPVPSTTATNSTAPQEGPEPTNDESAPRPAPTSLFGAVPLSADASSQGISASGDGVPSPSAGRTAESEEVRLRRLARFEQRENQTNAE